MKIFTGTKLSTEQKKLETNYTTSQAYLGGNLPPWSNESQWASGSQ